MDKGDEDRAPRVINDQVVTTPRQNGDLITLRLTTDRGPVEIEFDYAFADLLVGQLHNAQADARKARSAVDPTVGTPAEQQYAIVRRPRTVHPMPAADGKGVGLKVEFSDTQFIALLTTSECREVGNRLIKTADLVDQVPKRPAQH